MKKNILSLVAFMAFSVGAFANTIEVKEEVVDRDCYYEAEQAESFYQTYFYNFFYIGNQSLSSFDFFTAAYESCADSGECSTCLQGN